MNCRGVAADEETLLLEGGRYRRRPRRAAGTVEQVLRSVRCVSTAADVFTAACQREPVGERMADQQSSGLGRGRLHNSDGQVSWYVTVLIVRLDDPASLCIGVFERIHHAVVLDRRSKSLVFRMAEITHSDKLQAVRPPGIGQRSAEPGIAVRVVPVIPA